MSRGYPIPNIDIALRKGACDKCVHVKKCMHDFVTLKMDGKSWCAGFVEDKLLQPVKVLFT